METTSAKPGAADLEEIIPLLDRLSVEEMYAVSDAVESIYLGEKPVAPAPVDEYSPGFWKVWQRVPELSDDAQDALMNELERRCPDDGSLTPEQLAEMKRQEAAYNAGEMATYTWQEVRAQMNQQLRAIDDQRLRTTEGPRAV